MMQCEFESLITAPAPTDEQYEVIEKVYTYHPLIGTSGGKQQVAALYDLMGYSIFEEMLPKADERMELETQISSVRSEIRKKEQELKELELKIKSL